MARRNKSQLEHAVLKSLSDGGLNISRIVQRANVNYNTAKDILSDLEKRGIIHRTWGFSKFYRGAQNVELYVRNQVN